eukprot:1922326-Prymnesium_polylepis.3
MLGTCQRLCVLLAAAPPANAASATPSSATMGDESGINLMALSMQQLGQLKQSIEEVRRVRSSAPRARARAPTRVQTAGRAPQELQGLQGALQQLQVSKSKLAISKQSLGKLQATPAGLLRTPPRLPASGGSARRPAYAQIPGCNRRGSAAWRSVPPFSEAHATRSAPPLRPRRHADARPGHGLDVCARRDDSARLAAGRCGDGVLDREVVR